MCDGRNKWRGATMGPRGRERTQGGGRALDPRGQVPAPPDVFSVPDIFKYFRKNHTKFSRHLENYYFWGIFYCMDNSENRQKILFLLYSI